MVGFRSILGAGLFAAALAGGTAHAGTYAVTVSEGLSNGSGFDTAASSPYSGTNTASATFTYTGALNFDNTAGQNGAPPPTGDLNSSFGFSTSNISGYAGSGTVTYNGTQVANYGNTAPAGSASNAVSNFLASSGSAGGYLYGSYYTFDLGTLAAGTSLTVTHDDGISVYQGNTRIGNTVSGPTSAVTDTVLVTTTGDTILRYSRQNGTPSILQVSVPEPGTFALLGVGLLGLGLAVRRRGAGSVKAA